MFNPILQAMLDAQRRKEEEDRKARAFAALLGGLSQSPLFPSLLTQSQPIKRKVFISYHHGDDVEVNDFIRKWVDEENVFIPKGIGLRFTDDIINSNDPEYVMSQIKERYLEDSTVTIVLVGACTHSRRYVDWEIKASLRQELYSSPNGLIGIILPSRGRNADLPPRFERNWINGHVNCYARYWIYPRSAEELRGWIEDAYSARTTRASLIVNPAEIMKYNAMCNTCHLVHAAG